jgi:methylglutamate dehydrogenase subunit D
VVDPALIPRAPFEGLRGGGAGGVIAIGRDGLGMASVLLRSGRREALTLRLRASFGIDPPHGPRRVAAGTVALIGAGVGSWLALNEAGGNAFAVSLKDAVGDAASVADQSDAYTLLRLSGPHVRDALGRLVNLDLHPSAFAVGAVARTTASHVGVTLWRLADALDHGAVFEIAMARSLTQSFWRALMASAAEFGLALRTA